MSENPLLEAMVRMVARLNDISVIREAIRSAYALGRFDMSLDMLRAELPKPKKIEPESKRLPN